VSLGAWLLGLEVEHVDDRSLCCATPPGTYVVQGSFAYVRARMG
jgi:hypothetical protein